MVTAWIIFWSFLPLRGLPQHGPLYGLSCHHRSSTVDGDVRDHFLVFSVTVRTSAADGDNRDHFQVFPVTARPAAVDSDNMDHFLLFSLTARPAAADGDSCDHFLVFPVTIVLPLYMVRAGTIFWSFMSPRGQPL